MPKDEPKTCFIIAPIGAPDSQDRKRSDQVMRYIFEPVLSGEGYKVVRADKIPEPGTITSQIIQHLVDDDLVLADLTSHNANVFYELAIRHAVRLPCIQLIHFSENIPFDIAQTRTIKFNYQDLDSVDECKEELKNQIEAVKSDTFISDNPISNAIEFKALKQSSDPRDKASAQILELLHGISSRLALVEANQSANITIPSFRYTPTIIGADRDPVVLSARASLSGIASLLDEAPVERGLRTRMAKEEDRPS